MVKIDDILSEFVKELGTDFILVSKVPCGVTFYYSKMPSLKFGIATSPLFGIKKDRLGLVTMGDNNYPEIDCTISVEDPKAFNYFRERITTWCHETHGAARL